MLPCDKIICLFFSPQRSFLKHTKHDFMKQQICFLTLKEVSMGAYDHWQMRRLGLSEHWQILGCIRNLMLQTLKPSRVKSVGVWITMSRKWEQTTRKKKSKPRFLFSMTSKSYSFHLHGFFKPGSFSFLSSPSQDDLWDLWSLAQDEILVGQLNI